MFSTYSSDLIVQQYEQFLCDPRLTMFNAITISMYILKKFLKEIHRAQNLLNILNNFLTFMRSFNLKF